MHVRRSRSVLSRPVVHHSVPSGPARSSGLGRAVADRRSAPGRLARSVAAAAAALAAGAVLTVGGAAAAVPIRPIGANQTFIGEVDSPASSGVADSIAVVCTTTSKMGHPAAGQSVKVEPAPATAGGFTGSKATRILVTFPAPSVSSTDVVILVAYGEQGTIPKSLELPCSGEGVVRFTPSPTSKTARPFLLHVTFRPSSAPSPTRASATR